jgi:hypothetical protein
MESKLSNLVVLLLLSCAPYAFATTHTVSNVPSTLAQFSSIQDACDAAVSGDTIYVYGSPNTYPVFTILDKQLTIIGPGWSPVKNLPYTAQVAGVNVRDSGGPGAPDGSEIQGIVFTQTANLGQALGGDTGSDNLRLIRCMFNTSVNFSYSASGILFEGCVFYSTISFSGSQTYQNILFQNNFFFMNLCCVGAHVSGLTNSINVRFDHNLFCSTNNNGGNTVAIFSSNCNAITLSNNIFNQANAGLNLNFSTFTNNITNNSGLNAANATSNATPWLVNSNVDGGGNVSNQNPQMADMTSINAGNGTPTLNFTISAGPANNSGSDGKDMGLLFDSVGSLNWDNSRNSRVPRIFSMNITTPTIPVGGNLSVTVEARKSN